jgi:hypothetical protein
MRSFGVTHRANVACVDHPEHHDQAKPNRKGRYELVVQLEATAKTKDSSLAFSSALVVRAVPKIEAFQSRSVRFDQLVSGAKLVRSGNRYRYTRF